MNAPIRSLGLALAVAACASERITSPGAAHPTALNASIVFLPPSVTGQQAFESQCTPCHSNRDGFDAAYFSYTDTNIVRRALGHVDTATAWRIADYIRLLSVPKVPESTRLFQPGGGLVLGTDASFAVQLFGADQWPSSLTRAQLLAIDPRDVAISFALPQWSNEANKPTEWVAKTPLDAATLDFGGARVRTALASYEASPSPSTLGLAVQAIWEVTKTGWRTPDAPCPYQWRKTAPDWNACFNALTWASSLGADYMLRRGLTGFVDARLSNVWWQTGMTAHHSRQQTSVPPVPSAKEAAEVWFYLGWMMNPAGVEAIYTTTLLKERGRPRQATWVAERSLVARLPNVWSEDVNPFADFLEVTTVAPTNWTVNATRFALAELLRRLQSGGHPPAANVYTARSAVQSGMAKVKARITAAEYAPLQALANQVLALL